MDRIGYGIIYRQSIYTLSFWNRLLIRFAHARTDWASDYCVHECGFYFEQCEAEQAAAAMHKRYGGLWLVKPMPIGAVMGPQPIRIGPTIMFGGGAKAFYRFLGNRGKTLISQPLSSLQDQEQKLQEVIDQSKRLFEKVRSLPV